jgi:hypothetical protein
MPASSPKSSLPAARPAERKGLRAGTSAGRISERHDCDKEGTQVHRGQIARIHTLPKVPRTSGRAGEVGHARRHRGGWNLHQPPEKQKSNSSPSASGWGGARPSPESSASIGRDYLELSKGERTGNCDCADSAWSCRRARGPGTAAAQTTRRCSRDVSPTTTTRTTTQCACRHL